MVNYLKRRSPVALAALGAVVGLAIIAHSKFAAVYAIAPLAALVACLAYFGPAYFLSLFLFLFPLVGFLNPHLKINGCPLFLPVFYAGLAGLFLGADERAMTDFWRRFRWPIKAYIAGLSLSVVVAFIWLFPVSDPRAVVSVTPWGSIEMANAVGWILLSFFILLLGPLFGRLVADVAGDVRSVRLMMPLAAGILLAFAVGFAQYNSWTKVGVLDLFLIGGKPQFNATFTDPNALGMTAALLIALWTGFMRTGRFPKWAWGLVPALLFLVFISASRSALLAVLVIALCFLGQMFTKYPKRALAAFVLISGLLLLFQRDQTRRYGDRSRFVATQEKIRAVVKGDMPPSFLLGDRLTLWNAALVTIKHNMWWGTGLGLYMVRMPAYAAEIKTVVNDNTGSQYLQIVAEQGIFGLCLFVWLIGFAVWSYARAPAPDPLKDGCFFGLCGFLVSAVFGAHLIHFEVTLVFWLLLALITHEHPARN